jgi:hypothetical protein
MLNSSIKKAVLDWEHLGQYKNIKTLTVDIALPLFSKGQVDLI